MVWRVYADSKRQDKVYGAAKSSIAIISARGITGKIGDQPVNSAQIITLPQTRPDNVERSPGPEARVQMR
jgi:hypothetical protein